DERLVSASLQSVSEPLATTAPLLRRFAELPAELSCHARQCLQHAVVGGGGTGEKLAEQPVVAGRHAQRERSSGASVELRRPARPGTGASAGAAEAGLEQPVLDELVQMVGGE